MCIIHKCIIIFSLSDPDILIGAFDRAEGGERLRSEGVTSKAPSEWNGETGCPDLLMEDRKGGDVPLPEAFLIFPFHVLHQILPPEKSMACN